MDENGRMYQFCSEFLSLTVRNISCIDESEVIETTLALSFTSQTQVEIDKGLTYNT
jgi:hypothetical protein